MARRNKNQSGRNAPVDAWVTQVEEAPRADLPESKQVRRMKWIRKYLWVSAVGFFPLLLLLLVSVAGDDVRQPVEVTRTAMTEAETQARAVAMGAVKEWLESPVSPAPTARLLTWDGATAVEPVEAGPNADPATFPNLETHRVTLVTDTGVLYSASVMLEVSNVGAVAVSGPSLIPYTPSPERPSQQAAWPGSQRVTIQTPVVEAATAWGRAFTSGDPAQLRLLVGDPDPAHSYVPLPAIEMVQLSALEATPAAGAKTTDGDGRAVDPDKLIVRVEAEFQWPGQESRAGGFQSVQYDLLVEDANTGSPRVVAWGGPGSGPSLVAYANAVSDVKVVANEAPVLDDPGAGTGTDAGTDAGTEAGTDTTPEG